MLRWIQRAVVIIASMLPAACSVPVRAPAWSFGKVTKAESDGLEIVSAFNTTVKHGLGLTLSISGTYLPGTERLPVKRFSAPIVFDYESHGGWRLLIRAPATCQPSATGRAVLYRALESKPDRPADKSNSSVILTLVPAGVTIQRYAFSLRSGRRYALAFDVPCEQGRADDALWLAAMVGVHESTHADLRMMSGPLIATERRERLAIGAEACVLAGLSAGNRAFYSSHPALGERLSGQYGLQGDQRSPEAWCRVWTDFAGGVNR